jgi:DNA adenine methylase
MQASMKAAAGKIARSQRPSVPIKWHGGKTYLATAILQMMPAHTHYVEPFFGGGAVLFRKPNKLVDGHSEVINDVYADLINFWKVLSSEKDFALFKRKVAATPFSKPAWEEALVCTSANLVDRAVAFFIRYRQSRQGLGRDFATLSRRRTRRGMNEQVSAWLSAIEGLDEAHERLSRVVIYQEDATSVIRREDDDDTFFYCDPPYVAETRVVPDAYTFEMTISQHEDLLETLSRIRGKFILSGYRSKLYDKAAKQNGWSRRDIEIDNKASSQQVKPKKIECIWTNY